jgi:hypothetical protein
MALPAFWRSHIEAWQASSLTQAAYCRRHGLNPGTFSGRLREYRTEVGWKKRTPKFQNDGTEVWNAEATQR